MYPLRARHDPERWSKVQPVSRRQYYVGAGSLFLVVFVAAVIRLALAGHALISTMLVAIGWSIVVIGLAGGLADALAPTAMLRWRADWLAKSSNELSRVVASGASTLLDAAGDRPWENPSAAWRVRLLGIVLVCVFAAMAVALWWLPGQIDAMFAT